MKELDRVRWRCRRGMLELDIILQRFVDKHYTQLNDTELQQFDTFLNLPDNDLWDMITAKKEIKDIKLQPMLQLLQIV
ncbi:MAG: succinate dehydrogenase assembly factor 2 family protein [Betaproteobacteria bacterium]|nr:MAG: succinate dehydrogenase assembly factor 2 family protein [Betaproteobacteria bacterium]